MIFLFFSKLRVGEFNGKNYLLKLQESQRRYCRLISKFSFDNLQLVGLNLKTSSNIHLPENILISLWFLALLVFHITEMKTENVSYSIYIFLFSVLMWRMAHLPAAALWTPRPPLALVWSSTLTSPVITSAENPSSTALTATMICHPSPCHATPPSPLNCK